ncbi:MAG: lipopolysaccharide biosynthesis protein [Burkholderiaceae bacterium]|nr:lipopolysaccharide biosynthesis protein [Burkholderiaceae bacterium]
MSLLATAVQAFKWSLLGELGSRVIGPLVFIVLARILLPEDFGVVAAATVAISFSQVFWDSGLARALIQHNADDDDELANAVFWANLALSAVVTIAMWLAAPALAAFFRDDRIADVLRVLSVQAPLAATCALITALMQKHFDFKRLFWVRLVTTGGPGLVSIPLALAGWSYWALVFGVMSGQLLQLLALWRQTGWRPRARIDRRRVAELAGFAQWTISSGMLGWLYSWLDAIVVGRFLGAHDMGVYRTGNTFVTVVFGLLFSPLLPVLYTLFSRAQQDLARLREALMTVVQAIALVSLPIGAGLMVLGEALGVTVFGLHWAGVGLVIGILGLSHAIGWVAGANGELYRAIGKPHVETSTVALMLAVYVPVYLVAVQDGMQSFLWARMALSALALVAHVMVCRHALGIPPGRWLRACAPALAAACGAAVIVHWMSRDAPFTIARLTAMGLLGFVLYALAIVALQHSFLLRLREIARLGPQAAVGGNDLRSKGTF